MILPELTEDDKKFIDEVTHTMTGPTLTLVAVIAKINNISMRQAEKEAQEWYKSQIIPILEAHIEKHHSGEVAASKRHSSNELVS